MQNTKQDVSVVICSYSMERWQELIAAVESLRGQTVSPLEVIVVIDHNPALFERACASIPNVRLIDNPVLKGLSGARNAGIAASRGDFIAFLDDDAVAEAHWLEKLSAQCAQPGVLGSGGKVIPHWLAKRPTWFPDEFGWVLGYTYPGLPETAAAVRNFFGASMCFRRSVFETVGGFRSEMGRINKKPLGCEETELCIRALQKWPKSKLIYEPLALIYHDTPADRTTWTYFASRCFAEGLSKAIVTKYVGSKDGLSSERSYISHILPDGIASAVSATLFHKDWSGVSRAAAILLGVAVTGAGYITGMVEILFAWFLNLIPKRRKLKRAL
jgi:GT2 family glycosyltransferase